MHDFCSLYYYSNVVAAEHIQPVLIAITITTSIIIITTTMFCWPSRSKSAKAKLKIKNLSSSTGKKASHHHHRPHSGTFKCDLSEALLGTDEKCSSEPGEILLFNTQFGEDFHYRSLWGKDISEWELRYSATVTPEPAPPTDNNESHPCANNNEPQNSNNDGKNEGGTGRENNCEKNLEPKQIQILNNNNFSSSNIINKNNGSGKHVKNAENNSQNIRLQQEQKGCDDSLHEHDDANRPPIVPVTCAQDRNRLGPDGKQISSDHHHAHHPETHNASVSSTTSTVSHKSHSSGAVNVKSAGSLASARQVNHSGHIIGDGANNNNNAGTTGGSSCNSVSALTRENTRLKEELSHQYDLVTDLRTQLDKSTECQSETKLRFEAQLNSSHERFLALSLVVQLLDSKRSALEKKLDDERRLAQGREDQLVERQKEVENLRLEFERERECIQEELAVMRRTDESQVEKIKELGDELRKTEEQLASLSQSHQDEVNLLKKKQEEELETVRIKSRELNDEDVKAHLLKRSLSSPHPCNSPNDILQKEISSQQVVIDMRNEQIRKLQQDLLTQKALLDDLSTCKEHNKTLLAKVEDLNAQLAKSRCDKQEVQKKYQDAEAGATTAQSQISQLRYENEQLKWKLQSLRTDAKVNELMSKSAVQLGCDNRINLDYETAVSSLLVDANYRLEPDLTGPPNGCVKQ